MKDPIPPPPQQLVKFLQPFCDYINLPLLPAHAHELFFSLSFYNVLYLYLGPRISTYLAPKSYPNLKGRSKLDWDIHVVSLTQATVMSLLSQYAVLFDEERKRMNVQERAYGDTDFCALVLAVANGYFIWHLVMMVYHVSAYGVGMLAHAFATNFLMILGFRPAFLTYGVASYLYEWSNIPLNIHRGLSKLNMQKSKIYVANGVALFVMFFFSRIIWGTYLTSWFLRDIYTTYITAPPKGVEKLPTWLLAGHAVSGATLQGLNYMWFWMITRLVLGRVWHKQESKWTGVKEE